jgi:hypothetical protein
MKAILLPDGATMAEVLVTFEPPVTDDTGRSYSVRICGRVAADRLWDGWIEFEPVAGGPTLRTPRETQQPNRSDLEYWATGLTLSYLEGALERARRQQMAEPTAGSVSDTPAFAEPAQAAPRSAASSAHPSPPSRAVLDPFEVFTQGEEVLRQELSALDEGHLINIIRAYALAEEDESGLTGLRRPALAEMIIAAVRARLG